MAACGQGKTGTVTYLMVDNGAGGV